MESELSTQELVSVPVSVSVDDSSLENQGLGISTENQGGKKSKKGGNGLTDLAVPAVLVLANNMYKKKGGKKRSEKKGGKKRSAKKSRKSAKKSRKSRK
jgi:hypothetical protein